MASMRVAIDGSTLTTAGASVSVKDGTGCGEPSNRRSEEHTSELQSQSNLVCRLLLEKKKINTSMFARRNAMSRPLTHSSQARSTDTRCPRSQFTATHTMADASSTFVRIRYQLLYVHE